MSRGARLILALGALAAVATVACRLGGAVPARERLGTSVRLAAADEPGAPLRLTGRVLAEDAATPLAGARLRVYQTDDTGYYRRGPFGLELGQARARLSDWLITDEHGFFTVETIRPAGYPGERDPAHIHVDLRAGGYARQEHTLYFEGDPRLTNELRAAVRASGRGAVLPLVQDERGLWSCVWVLTAVAGD